MGELIPSQLKNKKFRFLIPKLNKQPRDQNWQYPKTEGNHDYESPQLQDYIRKHNLYGVVCGFGGLQVLDFDDLATWDKFKERLPPTLTVKTRAGYHYYYITDKPINSKIKRDTGQVDDKGRKKFDTLIDIQGEGAQVIGANSDYYDKHGIKHDLTYQIINDVSINQLKYEELKFLLNDLIEPESIPKEFSFSKDPINPDQNFSKDFKISDYDPSIKPGKQVCPFHSDSVPSFNVNKDLNLWYCHAGCGGGNTITYIAKKEGITNREAYLKLIMPGDEKEKKSKYLEIREKIFRLLYLKEVGQATEIIVRECYKRFNFVSILNDDKEEIWVYREGVYLPIGKSIIEIVTREILKEEYNQLIGKIVFSKIYADTKLDMDTFFNQQNKEPYLIPVQNGILNLKTKELKEFDPNYYFFNKLPVEFKPQEECFKFKQFVKSIISTEEDYLVLQEMFGDCLVKKNKYKKSFMLEGGGDNGKSQLLKVLSEYLLGIDNFKGMSLSSIEKDQYIVSELQNKLANISGDITDGVLNNTGRFKELSGADPINCSRKFKTSINFVSYATLIFATNDLPIPKDTSEGFWGRWILIQFPKKFLSPKEYDELTKEDQQKCKIATPDIINSFVNEEMSGVLNWAIEGLHRLLENNRFTYQNTRKQTEQVWLTKANSVLAFIKEYIREDYDHYVSKSEFKKQYLAFCKMKGLKKYQIRNDRDIKSTLEEECGAVTGKQTVKSLEGNFENTKQINTWEGIISTFSTFSMLSEPGSVPIGNSTVSKKVEKVEKVENKKSVSSIYTTLLYTFDFVENIKIVDLIHKMKSNYDFDDVQIQEAIKKLKEKGELTEMPLGVLRKL